MTTVHVGIAQMEISNDPQTVLMAANLGSCLGVIVYDSEKRLGGMIHCLLPLSKADPAKAAATPSMYVDTGVAKLIDEVVARGAQRDHLRIYVAGGAQINDPNNVFEIGKKNITVLRKLLWKNNLLIAGQDVGEDYSRTVSLSVGTGEVTVKAKGELKTLR